MLQRPVDLTPSLLTASVSPCYVSKSVAHSPSHKRNHTASREASRRNAVAIVVSERVPLSEALYAGAACTAVYRLVTRPPQRLSMGTPVGLCDILGRTPNDPIVPEAVTRTAARSLAGGHATR